MGHSVLLELPKTLLICTPCAGDANAAIYTWQFQGGDEATAQWCRACDVAATVSCQAHLSSCGEQTIDGGATPHSIRTTRTIRLANIPRLQCLAASGTFVATGSATGEVIMWLAACTDDDWQLQPVSAISFDAAAVTGVQLIRSHNGRVQAVVCLSDGVLAVVEAPLRD
jgi:hypothetical protein